MGSEPGKAKRLARGNLEEIPHISDSNYHEGTSLNLSMWVYLWSFLLLINTLLVSPLSISLWKFISTKPMHQCDHNGVITHLEPDTKEWEVKWALGRITSNKATGSDGIPADLFQILKDDAVKMLHSICQQIWKTQQGPQDWKRSVFIPIPKKGNAKECSNYHTIDSSHTLGKNAQNSPS